MRNVTKLVQIVAAIDQIFVPTYVSELSMYRESEGFKLL